MKTKKLRIRFSANPLPFSLFIRLKTWSKYSHVDICLSDGVYLGALPFKGVMLHSEQPAVQDFFEMEVTEEEYDKIIENALSQLGKPYDLAGILGFAFARNWQDPDKWFCSEVIAGAIQPVIPLFNEEASKISPRDLSIHVRFKKAT